MPLSRRALLGTTGALAAAIALSACGSSNGGSGAASSSASAAGTFPVTVEHKFGSTEVKGPKEGQELKVVALGWSDGENCLALGVKPIAVYDWLGFGKDKKGVGPWAVEKFGDVTPEVMERSDSGIDYELVQSLSPDLILNVNSGYDEKEYKRLSEIAPTISGPKDAQNFAPGWDNQTRMIGKALGLEEQGNQLVDDTNAKIKEVADKHPKFKGVQAVTGSKFGEAYGLSYTGDMRWDLMADLGFTMYSKAAAMKPDKGFYANVSEEQVSVFDAPVAVMFPIGYSLQELKDDKILNSLSVFKDGRAVLLDPEEDLVQAFSAGNPLSIGLVLGQLPPKLDTAVAKI